MPFVAAAASNAFAPAVHHVETFSLILLITAGASVEARVALNARAKLTIPRLVPL